MTNFIALIHKRPGSDYGVSFPDVPGVITCGGTIDEAMRNASDVLAFAAEDWRDRTGKPFPRPRSVDALRNDATFQRDAADALVAAVAVRLATETAKSPQGAG